MSRSDWNWANLSNDQLRMIREAEETLGADVLLAFHQDQHNGMVEEGIFTRSGLRVAAINDSQIECLQGLEHKLKTIIVAYQRAYQHA